MFILHKGVVKCVNSPLLFATGFFPLFGLKPPLQLAKNLHPFKDNINTYRGSAIFKKGSQSAENLLFQSNVYLYISLSFQMLQKPLQNPSDSKRNQAVLNKDTEFGSSRCQDIWLFSCFIILYSTMFFHVKVQRSYLWLDF